MLRVLATPRWVGWTLLAAVIVAGCCGMAYWQLLRAQSPTGSLLNAGYAFQWPLFGVFFAVMWWRLLRQEAQTLAEVVDTDAAEQDGLATDTVDEAGSSPFTARPAGVAAGGADGPAAPGSARAEYNAMLAELAARDRADQDAQAGAGETTEERARP